MPGPRRLLLVAPSLLAPRPRLLNVVLGGTSSGGVTQLGCDLTVCPWKRLSDSILPSPPLVLRTDRVTLLGSANRDDGVDAWQGSALTRCRSAVATPLISMRLRAARPTPR